MSSNAVVVTAPGRVDICAGPTDWCGGNTLNMAINLRARVTVEPISDPKLISITIGDQHIEYNKPEYGGGFDLFQAVIELTGLSGFAVKYETEIPKGSGLGGSAPLTVGTVMALARLYKKNWSKYYMAELAQRAETLKMQTVNGYQDQYAAMFGGLLFMNFEGKSCQRGQYSKPVESEPYATVEQLSIEDPGFKVVVAIPEIERAGSGQTNGSVSDRYLDGDPRIVSLINESMIRGRDAKKAVVDNDIPRLFELINQDNEMLREFGFVTAENERIIKLAMDHGADAARVCGAGRGAVGLYCRDEQTRDAVYHAINGTVPLVHKAEPAEGARYE